MFNLPCLLFGRGSKVITMRIKTKIRTLRLREGKSISEIARRTGLARNTVKKWLKEPEEAEPKYQQGNLNGCLTGQFRAVV